MASTRTKDLRNKRNIFLVLSYALWLIVSIWAISATFVAIQQKGGDGMSIFSPEFKQFLISMGVTGIIAIIGAIIIKDKIRTAIWMISLVLMTSIYHEPGMYTVLGCWLVDEYIFTTLAKYYGNRLTINKELDLRIEDRLPTE